jgi:hypothetical protein
MKENNSTYTIQIEDEMILDETIEIIENSIDIDPEFVDIVNDNFWELI